MTAYEREQTELRTRIEHLEREVVRLKAWTRPPAELCLKCGAGFGSPEHAVEPCVHGGT